MLPVHTDSETVFPMPAATHMVRVGMSQEQIFQLLQVQAATNNITNVPIYVLPRSCIYEAHLGGPFPQVHLAIQFVTKTGAKPSAAKNIRSFAQAH